jgi:hypothetical protein
MPNRLVGDERATVRPSGDRADTVPMSRASDSSRTPRRHAATPSSGSGEQETKQLDVIGIGPDVAAQPGHLLMRLFLTLARRIAARITSREARRRPRVSRC